jgi:hypothetical protein
MSRDGETNQFKNNTLLAEAALKSLSKAEIAKALDISAKEKLPRITIDMVLSRAHQRLHCPPMGLMSSFPRPRVRL